MKERLIQFDLLKGIGIICVLFGHTVLSGLPKDLIYGFHMPLFFFCSGIFFKNRSFKDVMTNNLRQLIVPYMFFLLALNGLQRPLWLFVYPICLKLHLNTPLFVAVEMITALVIILPVHNLISKYAPILIGKKENNL